MNKREFLAQLRDALAFELPEPLVRSNINYYADYIEREIAGGRSQEEVLRELGDPTLIARSVIDAAKSGEDGIPYTADDVDYSSAIFGGRDAEDAAAGAQTPQGGGSAFGDGRASGAYQRADYREDTAGTAGNHRRSVYSYHTSGCGGCILWILIAFALISVISTVLGLLSPILVPVCMVLVIIWLLKGMDGGGRGGRFGW